MNIEYFEDSEYQQLLPLTWLRAGFELRCGCDRLVDKVRRHLGPRVARLLLRDTIRPVVSERFELDPVEPGEDWCLLNSRAMVTGDLRPPRPGLAWEQNGGLVAAGVAAGDVEQLTAELFRDPDRLDDWLKGFQVEPAPEAVRLIEYPWELALASEAELRRQFQGGSVDHRGRVYPGAHFVHPEQIYVAPGACIKPGVVLDAEDGPIHIAEDAQIQANAVLEGPCYVGPRTIVRPGASLRAGTTIGPVCKVGGEIEASIFQGYSNKQHDGFLGHSFVAEWVNMGADTITSNLKNTYGTIRVSLNGVGVETGLHLVGSIIGDHAKTGIGTILPTGCIIGVAANVFTQSGVPKFVPSFAWLTDDGLTHCRTEKAIQIARIVMGRRDLELSEAERALLERTAKLARELEAPGWN